MAELDAGLLVLGDVQKQRPPSEPAVELHASTYCQALKPDVGGGSNLFPKIESFHKVGVVAPDPQIGLQTRAETAVAPEGEGY